VQPLQAEERGGSQNHQEMRIFDGIFHIFYVFFHIFHGIFNEISWDILGFFLWSVAIATWKIRFFFGQYLNSMDGSHVSLHSLW